MKIALSTLNIDKTNAKVTKKLNRYHRNIVFILLLLNFTRIIKKIAISIKASKKTIFHVQKKVNEYPNKVKSWSTFVMLDELRSRKLNW